MMDKMWILLIVLFIPFGEGLTGGFRAPDKNRQSIVRVQIGETFRTGIINSDSDVVVTSLLTHEEETTSVQVYKPVTYPLSVRSINSLSMISVANVRLEDVSTIGIHGYAVPDANTYAEIMKAAKFKICGILDRQIADDDGEGIYRCCDCKIHTDMEKNIRLIAGLPPSLDHVVMKMVAFRVTQEDLGAPVFATLDDTEYPVGNVVKVDRYGNLFVVQKMSTLNRAR